MAESPARLQVHLTQPPTGETAAQRALLAQVAGQLALMGREREQAVAFARRALAGGRLIADETADGLSWIWALAAMMYGDDLDGYAEHVEHVLADAQQRGSRIAFATASYSRAVVRYFRGDLIDAIADLQLSLSAAPDGFYFMPLAYARLVWCELDRDCPEVAAQVLTPIEDHPFWSKTVFYGAVLEARARLRAMEGRPQEAFEDAMEAIERADTLSRPVNPAVWPMRSTAALAARAIGEDGLAQALITEEVSLARAFGAPKSLAMSLRVQGLLASGREQLAPLEEAVGLLRESPARLEYARTLVDLGAARRRAGRREDAMGALRTGMDLAHHAGARVIERQAREELIIAGARPRRPAARGADALTPSERRVAELAAAGQSNRDIAQALFVTLRTVEAHLSASYRKLDITGRPKLAQALQAR